jgi:hypothetical protein
LRDALRACLVGGEKKRCHFLVQGMKLKKWDVLQEDWGEWQGRNEGVMRED